MRKPSNTLPEGEQKFRALVESVRDYAIFLLDDTGRIQTWNTGAELLKGYRPAEIIGKPFDVFYTQEDRIAGLPATLLGKAREHGRVENEGWRVRKDGTRFWADVVITPLASADGSVIGYSKVTRDLSERHRAMEELRRSEERFRLLSESVEDYAIFMLDPEGRVETWNEGARRIKGYDAHEIIGKHFSRFYTAADLSAGKCEIELAGAVRDGRFEDEGWRLRKDGTRFWANVVLTALRGANGTVIGFSKVTRDLTERRRLEEARVERAQAEEALRLRDEFLAIAAHELRTPLTALTLGLQTLSKDLALDEASKTKVLRATRGAGRLTDLVESLLDISRISTGRLTLNVETFDLGAAVTAAIDGMAPAAESARVTIATQIEQPLEATADKVRVSQIVTNLLGNALKYGLAAPVEVSLRRDGSDAVLEVRDHGPGIPEGDLDRIFGRFERASSMRHYGGLGLGLYVTRQIVDAHGGSVTATNAPDGGALLTVRIPLSAPCSAGCA